MGIFSQPDTVNSGGDVLSDSEKDALGIKKEGPFAPHESKYTPQQRGQMLYNWLTRGGPPKPLDPSRIFKDRQDLSGVEAKASAGQGINSLFGVGKTIGELTPAIEPVVALKPLKMIEPMNQSPMQTGVPYTALPSPGGK